MLKISDKNISEKIIVLGIDGMDPKLTRKFVDEGKMPNTQNLIERGAQRHDLIMLGAQPTVTPPMWTTLATGAYPMTHGITCFWRQTPGRIDMVEYNLDSRYCEAEQLWNVFAEAGKKTLVWHWPGSSWPPSSDSPNLSVVDGTSPGNVNMSVGVVDGEKILVASVNSEKVLFKAQAATDGEIPCVITDLQPPEKAYSIANSLNTKQKVKVMLSTDEGEGAVPEAPFDVVYSPIKDADDKWTNAPEGAKEFIMLHAEGLIRRPCLILKNDAGIYDKVAIYKSKKALEPIAILQAGKYEKDIYDEAIKNDKVIPANRNMRILELAENGEKLRMWISSGMDMTNDSMWHPKTLFQNVAQNIGYPQPTCMIGNASIQISKECMLESWTAIGDWQAEALNYLIEKEDYEIIFSHYHNVDLEGHMTIRYLKNGGKGTPEDYKNLVEMVYQQTDDYIGKFIHLLDKGWTILVVSDHAAVCPEHGIREIGDMTGINVGVMRELGFTFVKQDENGNDLHEIDWKKTKALAVRGNHIYLNLKGRNQHQLEDGTVIDGIVDPANQYQVEEEIMTGLYGYRDKVTGMRIIACALRNKDAVLLGLGGPQSGDIIYWTAEGYNYDHCDSLSTTEGFGGTSVSPIFIAAGKGLKENFETTRVIREVDVAPTIAVLGGIRMPAQCEGAPVYQILAD